MRLQQAIFDLIHAAPGITAEELDVFAMNCAAVLPRTRCAIALWNLEEKWQIEDRSGRYYPANGCRLPERRI